MHGCRASRVRRRAHGVNVAQMRRISFNDGWDVRPKVNRFAELIGEARNGRRSPCRTTP